MKREEVKAAVKERIEHNALMGVVQAVNKIEIDIRRYQKRISLAEERKEKIFELCEKEDWYELSNYIGDDNM